MKLEQFLYIAELTRLTTIRHPFKIPISLIPGSLALLENQLAIATLVPWQCILSQVGFDHELVSCIVTQYPCNTRDTSSIHMTLCCL